MAATEVSAYTQAVSSGQYARVTGLDGKYDNVRLQWEDRSFQVMLGPHLHKLLQQRRKQGAGLRLVDLGCGSGDGIETLLTISKPNPALAEADARLITEDALDQYTGLEMNPALLEQASQRFANQPRTSFQQADLREGLPFSPDEKPYDLYSASFGTLSHFDEEQTVNLFCEIAAQAAPGALLVGDWLGRYSYEWTTLWNEDISSEHWMDYRISYIYPPEQRDKVKIDSFGLRLVSDQEIRRILKKVSEKTGAKLEIKELFDRSLFIGRHMDTADYNPHAKPLRGPVNRLHETNCRTDLESLLFDLQLPEGFEAQSSMLQEVARNWNDLVSFTLQGLTNWDKQTSMPSIPSHTPPKVAGMMKHMWRLNEMADDMPFDDPRADWIEPQLACHLRQIELSFQQGLGCGHGLVAICEIQK